MSGKRYWERIGPSPETVAARSWLRSDAAEISLDGAWRFRLSPRADTPADLAEVGLDDGGWDELPVPAHWQLHGHGSPAYTNVRYPFPVDPPRVPDENPTGDYRRVFEVPSGWTDGRALLRFEGVDSCARVWLNGVEVGTLTGSRLPSELDVTQALRHDGPNHLAVRVHQWSSGSYLEDQDMWWLSGIFREVRLLWRPDGGLDDVHVRADYDHVTGVGTLVCDAVVHDIGAVARLRVPELGIDCAAGETVEVPDVQPWSAEVPRLYDATVSNGRETVSVRIGFRRVEVRDGILRVNGNRVLFKGVNRHEFHPDTGRTVDHATMLADVLLMKQHNVNAVRTSHYPPHPAFLDLCDEHGLYVVDECDLETHGFFDPSWSLIGPNPADDPAWEEALVDRMRRTVERDKNHPSIVMWSLGNESGSGRCLAAMARWAHDRDPSRPLIYERDWTAADVDVYSRMYTSHAEVEAIGRHEEEPLEDPAMDAVRRAKPFVVIEYAHAMGNGPGGLTEYQRLFETYPRCQGGFVWEWIDQALATTAPDGRPRLAYGGDFGEPLHDGNFVADGLLFPDRTPSPGLVELKKVLEPVRISVDSGAVTVTNLHEVRDLSYLRLTWAHEVEGVAVADGELDLPTVAVGESTTVSLPTPAAADAESWVTVRATLREDESWASEGHEIAWGQGQASSAALPAPASRAAVAQNDVLVLGPGRFDPRTGALVGLGDLEVAECLLDVWRAVIDNERDFAAEAHETVWRAAGLDRMEHRVDDVGISADALVVSTRTAAAGSLAAMCSTWRWTVEGDALHLHLDVRPEGEWPTTLPRLGVRLSLPATLTGVEWFGRGPGEAYPDSRQAARVGRFRSSVADLQTPYVFPQENGNRTEVRWAELTDGHGAGLRVEGRPHLELTARGWTSHDLDHARHTDELHERDRLWLNLDVAQNGLGSSSCGPGLLPRYELRPAASTFELTLRALGGSRDATRVAAPA